MDARGFSLLALTTLLFLGSPDPGPFAYPISPVTLWGLTSEATLVVLADIPAVTEATETGGTALRDAPSSTRRGGAGAIAHLRVREAWKGAASGTIEVAFDPNYICPAPPVYVAGKTVVAFLTADGDLWRTVALSYGTHYPAPADGDTSVPDELANYPARSRGAKNLRLQDGRIAGLSD